MFLMLGGIWFQIFGPQTKKARFPELGPCPHDNSCVGCRGTQLSVMAYVFCLLLLTHVIVNCKIVSAETLVKELV